MELVIILGLVYILYSSGALAGLGLGGPLNTPAMSTAQLQASQSALISQGVGSYPLNTPPTGVNGMSLAISAGTAVGGGAVAGIGSTATIAGLSGAALGAATAGIGAAVTVFAVLWAAHKKREAQAKSENSSVNVGVNGFDQDIKTVNSMYNSGQIDAQTAIRALQQALAQYYILVAPYIQPGRNGCSSGENCGTFWSVMASGQQPCAGDIGAGCCIGCGPLSMSLYDPGNAVGVSPTGPGAITVLQQGGGTSVVKTVGGSKYGTITRAGYSLVWQHVGAI